MPEMNGRGLALLKKFEGCKLQAYLCPAGVLTVGYGHTGADVKAGMRISQAQADELLAQDAAAFAAGVERAIGTAALGRTTGNQFSAMVCLAYNIGIGAFRSSSVLRLHKEGKPNAAAGAFKLWNKAGGRVLDGLVRRRAAEAALYAAD